MSDTNNWLTEILENVRHTYDSQYPGEIVEYGIDITQARDAINAHYEDSIRFIPKYTKEITRKRWYTQVKKDKDGRL